VLLLLGLADTVVLSYDICGAGKTAEVEHLRCSVIVINSAVTTDESHKARETKKRISKSVMTDGRDEGKIASSRTEGSTYEVSHAIPSC